MNDIIKTETIEKAIKNLEKDINEKQNQIDLIKNIDWSKPINENVWHKICKAPLSSSGLLEMLLKNIFPGAEEISINCDYIHFQLYGYKCALSTLGCSGVYIETCWYKMDFGEPNEIYPETHNNMKKYFNEKDNENKWETLFDHRFPTIKRYKRWIKFLLWFGKYKWKDDNRNSWEEEFLKDEKRFQEQKENYLKEREEMHQKVEFMVNRLIPELKKFSDKIYKLDGYGWMQVEEVAKSEGFSL